MSQDISQAKAPHTLREEGQFDYTIEVEDEEFKVHKNLMVSMSDYFKAMLTGGMVENQSDRVKLHGLSSVCVSNMIEFIYTGKLSTMEVDVEELLSCAVYLQMPTAIQECTTLLVNKLSNGNCFDTFFILNSYSLKTAVKQTTTYINANIEEIMQTCAPLEMSTNAFLCYVKFWIKAEWDLVSIVKEWIHLDYEDRQQYINDLMSCVRFGLLTPKQLKAIKEMDIYMQSEGAWHNLLGKAEDYQKLPMHQKVLDESEQCTVRQDPVPVCYTANDTSSSVFYSLYDGKSWKQHESLGAPELYYEGMCAHVTVNNFLILCEEHDLRPTTSQGWHIFDARTLKWSPMASMQVPRRAFALVHHGKHLYALGGRTPPKKGSKMCKVTDVIEQYDFEKDSWNIIPTKMPVPVEKHTAFSIDGLIYIGGGMICAEKFSERLDCLDLSTDTWYSKASLPEHPASSKPRNIMELDGEKVLFSLDDYYSMHIYRPSVDQWSKWFDCWAVANSKTNPEVAADVIVDENNNLFLYGYLSVEKYDMKKGHFNGFAKWTVVKPMEEISEVILDNYPAEQLLYSESEWVSIATFLAIPPQTKSVH